MKVLVCDDEPLARQRLTRLLNEIGIDTIFEAESGVSALEKVKDYLPEVILLDIEMPKMSGLEVARQLLELEHSPAIVFCTAYDEFALEAFQANAVDYLLKPVRKESLTKALEKSSKLNKAQLSRMLELRTIGDVDVSGSHRKSQISVKTPKGIELVAVEKIRLFKAEQKYVLIKTNEGDYLVDETLKELEQTLRPDFMRAHRSALVAVNYITALEQLTDGQWSLKLSGIDERVPVSRRHLAEVRRCLRDKKV